MPLESHAFDYFSIKCKLSTLPLTAMEDQSELIYQFERELELLKTMSVPDRTKIEMLRSQLDKAVEGNQISLHQWRTLVERCARIRRTARS